MPYPTSPERPDYQFDNYVDSIEPKNLKRTMKLVSKLPITPPKTPVHRIGQINWFGRVR
jgi:hypothetical protein